MNAIEKPSSTLRIAFESNIQGIAFAWNVVATDWLLSIGIHTNQPSSCESVTGPGIEAAPAARARSDMTTAPIAASWFSTAAT